MQTDRPMQDSARRGIMERTDSSVSEPRAVGPARARTVFLSQLTRHPQHVSVMMEVPCGLSGERLRDTLGKSIAQCGVLREHLVADVENELRVACAQDVRVPWEVHDFSSSTTVHAEEIRAVVIESELEPFDLTVAPLLRARLLVLRDHSILLLVAHRLIADRQTLIYLGQNAMSEDPALSEDHYAQFEAARAAWVDSPGGMDSFAAWKEAMRGAPPVSQLSLDEVDATGVGRFQFEVRPEQTAHLSSAAEQANAAIEDALWTVVLIWLHRHTNQSDIVVGAELDPRREGYPLAGPLADTLPFRSELVPGQRFVDMMREVASRRRALAERAGLSLADVLRTLQPERRLERDPLFQVVVDIESTPLPKEVLRDVPSALLGSELELHLRAAGEHWFGDVRFSRQLWRDDTMARCVRRLEALLSAFAEDPSQAVEDAPMLADGEREQMMREFNDTAHLLEGPLTLHGLVEARARSCPDAVAVESEDGSLTYAQLVSRARRVGRALARLGVGPDVLVAVVLERSIEMVVGLLGVLEAGAAYVPIEPTLPRERIRYILEDTNAQVLLTTARSLDSTAELPVRVVKVDEAAGDEAPAEAEPLAGETSRPDDCAYVIYTSGSTGRPKGVANTHLGIVNRVLWGIADAGLEAGERVLMKTPYGFDVSLAEVFGTLAAGATLVVARPEGHKDSRYLIDTIVRKRITQIHFVPSMLALFLEEPDIERCTSLRRVLCSGEALLREHAEQLRKRLGVQVINLYGPTEAAVDVTSHHHEGGDQGGVPIGKPAWNVTTHVINGTGDLAPIGVAGELLLGGICLSRGYVNRTALTAATFVPAVGEPATPALRSTSVSPRAYRTGDLARWDPRGVLTYLGRLDHQVKVRGFRIELGEIEAVLRTHPAVREATVVPRMDSGGMTSLVAYFVASDPVTPDQLREHLARQLPEYMVPAAMVPLPELPHTASGKVARNELPVPDWIRSGGGRTRELPRNDLERELAEIWSDILQVPSVGVLDDFFSLGGHSLLALRMMNRIRRRFGVELPLEALFPQARIRDLAAKVLTGVSSSTGSAEVLVPLSPESGGRTFFCVHPIGGHVVCYGLLARLLSPEVSLYGLRARGVSSDSEPQSSIPEMAATYIRAIRSSFPQGPYRIGGWSFGGIIAFEMARQLKAAGERVDALVLIDSPPLSPAKQADLQAKLSDDAARLASATRGLISSIGGDAVAVSAETLRALPEQERWQLAIEHVRTKAKLSASIEDDRIRRYLHVLRKIYSSADGYQMHHYEDDIVFLQCEPPASVFAFPHDDDVGGWSPYARWVRRIEIPGDHFRLMQPPHVERLAEALREVLLA